MGPITAQEVSTCNYVFTVPTALSCLENGQCVSCGSKLWLICLCLSLSMQLIPAVLAGTLSFCK
jgi:hypothetical protein